MPPGKRKCVVSGCPAKEKCVPGRTYFKFPKDPLLRARWVELTQVSPDINFQNKTSKVCALHFENKFMYKGQKRLILNPDAVPTIFPVRAPFPTYSTTKSEAKAELKSTQPRSNGAPRNGNLTAPFKRRLVIGPPPVEKFVRISADGEKEFLSMEKLEEVYKEPFAFEKPISVQKERPLPRLPLSEVLHIIPNLNGPHEDKKHHCVDCDCSPKATAECPPTEATPDCESSLKTTAEASPSEATPYNYTPVMPLTALNLPSSCTPVTPLTVLNLPSSYTPVMPVTVLNLPSSYMPMMPLTVLNLPSSYTPVSPLTVFNLPPTSEEPAAPLGPEPSSPVTSQEPVVPPGPEQPPLVKCVRLSLNGASKITTEPVTSQYAPMNTHMVISEEELKELRTDLHFSQSRKYSKKRGETFDPMAEHSYSISGRGTPPGKREKYLKKLRRKEKMCKTLAREVRRVSALSKRQRNRMERLKGLIAVAQEKLGEEADPDVFVKIEPKLEIELFDEDRFARALHYYSQKAYKFIQSQQILQPIEHYLAVSDHN